MDDLGGKNDLIAIDAELATGRTEARLTPETDDADLIEAALAAHERVATGGADQRNLVTQGLEIRPTVEGIDVAFVAEPLLFAWPEPAWSRRRPWR